MIRRRGRNYDDGNEMERWGEEEGDGGGEITMNDVMRRRRRTNDSGSDKIKRGRKRNNDDGA